MTPNSPIHGVMLMLAAVACFAALDSTTKLVTVAVPMLVAVWFRYAFQAVMTVITLWPSQRQRLFETQRPGLHLARGLLLVATSALAFLSLKVVSVGEFTAIVMLSPIVMSVVSAWRLKQNPGTVGWVCVLGGFVGVLIVMRPGSSLFGWASLLPLGLVATNSAYQLITSELGKTDDLGLGVVEDAKHVHDLQATILHQLGLNHERLTYNYSGRNFRLTDVHGHVVQDVLA